MIYNNNDKTIIELKKLFLEEKITQKKIAENLNMSKQNFNRLINKNETITLETLNAILNTMGYDLEINFIKRK